MERVALSSDFVSSYARLSEQVKGKVTAFLTKFRSHPSGPDVRFEEIPDAADDKICAVRMTEDILGIVVRQPECGIYLLLWVAGEAEAMAWGATRKCDVNPLTGAIQIYDIRVQPSSTVTSLFAGISDDDLLKLAVPAAQIPFIRSLSSEEEFYSAADRIPQDAFESLTWLVEGFPLNEVLDLVAQEAQPAEGSSEDLAQALDRTTTQRSFVVVEGEEELQRIMAAPLEKWRVFLHPTQSRIVKRNYSGAARVLGGAGTGKTVVAMHRARFLASGLPDGQKILFTTFTANLAADIRENLKKICSAEELRRIEVIHLDAWISQYLRESGFDAEVRYDDTIEQLWMDAILMSATDLSFPVSFYEEEWNRVAIAQEALTKADYMKATRNGRGTALNRKKRLAVWDVFECYMSLYRERHIRDSNTAMYECGKLLLREGKARYAHIIVDEGQDFSDNAFRLLRTLAGEPHPNDLFIVGDTHQRIYRNRPVLSRCGIQVRGRSSILRINYRTTEEIRRFAFRLLQDSSFDDLDESEDAGDSCRSLLHGEPPVVRNFPDANAEFNYVCNEVLRLQAEGVPLSDICIVVRTNKLVEDYCDLFKQAGISCYAIKRNRSDNRRQEGLRVATMHRVKGLEFQYVFVCAVNRSLVPLKRAISHTDAVSEQESITAEKCLLYVAITRAQKGAWITSYGTPSEFFGTT